MIDQPVIPNPNHFIFTDPFEDLKTTLFYVYETFGVSVMRRFDEGWDNLEHESQDLSCLCNTKAGASDFKYRLAKEMLRHQQYIDRKHLHTIDIP